MTAIHGGHGDEAAKFGFATFAVDREPPAPPRENALGKGIHTGSIRPYARGEHSAGPSAHEISPRPKALHGGETEALRTLFELFGRLWSVCVWFHVSLALLLSFQDKIWSESVPVYHRLTDTDDPSAVSHSQKHHDVPR